MGHDDQKLFMCTSCRKDVMATKFASQKTIQCDECKADKKPIDPEIVAEALAKLPQKNTKSKSDVIVGDKKPATCTSCGKDMMIGKFASLKSAVCNECGGHTTKKKISSDEIKIDISKVNMAELPNIEEMYVMPSVIANSSLRNVECPSCGHKMNIIRIMDTSADRGLIISYQCQDEKCLLLMTVSEQSRFKVSPKKSHEIFNYRGELITDLTSGLEDVRIKNSMEMMYNLLVDNNIPLDGVYIPEYITTGDYEKKNPIGMRKDELGDIIKWLKTPDTAEDTGFGGGLEDITELIHRLEKIRGIFED